MPNAVDAAKSYFRNYAALLAPLHEALVRDCCACDDIPDDLPSVLEDIGQDFVYLSELVNAALQKRQDQAPAEADRG